MTHDKLRFVTADRLMARRRRATRLMIRNETYGMNSCRVDDTRQGIVMN